MPLTMDEILSDLPAGATLIQKVDASIAAYNGRPKTVGSAMLLASEILAAAAPLADQIEAQSKS